MILFFFFSTTLGKGTFTDKQFVPVSTLQCGKADHIVSNNIPLSTPKASFAVFSLTHGEGVDCDFS